MAAYQTKQLSTPKVIIDGVVVAIVPNSCEIRIPGESKVRAMNAGGGAVQIVSGVNAETLIGHVKFDIAATAQNADRVRAWKQKMLTGVGMTCNIVEDGVQFPHQDMAMTKDTTIHAKSDGNITIEMEGQALF